MQSKVTVVADDNGNVIRQSQNNPDYGYVRVTQDAVQYGANGWVNRKSRSALILGLMDDLKEIGLGKLKTLPGKIVIKESTEPFNSSNPDRDLKIAGSTGIICCTADGEPIYRTTFYDATGLQEDTLVPHANGAAIREANAAGVVADGATKIANSTFDLEKEEEASEEVEDSIEEIEESEESAEEVDEVENDSFEL
jgi:hypothetical protein|tara:strand:+ start:19473 stop:20060 length:588 start_codon:yes stop_codon:yes gene_type:complete